jgi:prepilin-type N-terminal cleavage/methylation domain-containing protein
MKMKMKIKRKLDSFSKKKKAEQGFTLVELAIVLVIIGLIIGGVLVGQDMIKSAEIRSTIKQWEQYNSAVNTFRDKYRYIPGDINGTRAVEFGLTTRTGAAGKGDGNGLLQACAATTAAGLLAGCETTMFWRDLNETNMMDGYFRSATDALAAWTTVQIPVVFPETKIGRGNYWTVFSAEGKNWYEIANITDVTVLGVYTLTPALSPFEAYNIDRKTDDNRPLYGGVRAMTSLSVLNSIAVAGTAVGGVTCVEAGATYNQTTEALANTPACQLRMRFM